MKTLLHLFLCLALSASLLFAQEEKITLRGRIEHPPGTFYKYRIEHSLKEVTMSYEIADRVIKDKATFLHSTTAETRFVKTDEIELIYREDYTQQSFTFMGVPQQQDTHGPLEGLLIMGRWENGKWRYTLEDAPTPEQEKALQMLEHEMPGETQEGMLYPDHPVAIGERWDLDPKAIQAYINFPETLSSSGRGGMKLYEIVDHEGHRCAHLYFVLEVTLRSLDMNNEEILLEANIKGDIYRSLDIFMDIEGKFSGQMKMTGERIIGRKRMNTCIAGPVNQRFSVEFHQP